METVRSQDGTIIAYDRLGSGPPLILVAGALGTRPSFAPLAELLAPDFTVISHDRRGRGDSGDTPPYAVEREVEDIEALIDAAGVTGGTAYLSGISSGAALLLEAASRLPAKISKLALYEPPFIVDDNWPPAPADYVSRVAELAAAGRRSEAVEQFMSLLQIPAEMLAQMKADPSWREKERVAHTLAYDGIIMGDTMSGRPLPPDRWQTATMPTLVITGGDSPTFFQTGADAVTAILPNATRRTLPGQQHGVEPGALAPVLREFFLT